MKPWMLLIHISRCCHLVHDLIQELNVLLPSLQEQSAKEGGSSEVLVHSNIRPNNFLYIYNSIIKEYLPVIP